jgi:outer membrane protein
VEEIVKKSHLIITICLAALLFTGSAMAQKLGYINSQKILADFKEAQDAQERLDKINKEWEAEGREMQRRLQELTEQLESQSLLLSEERKKEKQDEIRRLYQEIQQYQQTKWGQNGEIFKKEAEIMQPVLDKINAAIAKVGEDEKFDFIFDTVSANIVYASPNQPDLTELVLEELEKGLESSNN